MAPLTSRQHFTGFTGYWLTLDKLKSVGIQRKTLKREICLRNINVIFDVAIIRINKGKPMLMVYLNSKAIES